MWAFPERFEGRYVRLEPLALAHLPAFLRHYDPEVYRFLSRAPVAPTEEALRAHLEGLLGEPGRVNWAILLGEEVAGRISVIAPEPEHAKLELGTMLFKPFWGSPANKEAKYLLLRHAFEVLRAERVQFKVDLTQNLHLPHTPHKLSPPPPGGPRPRAWSSRRMTCTTSSGKRTRAAPSLASRQLPLPSIPTQWASR
ncbi:hypothetical protein TthSNM11_22120 [Thermus thermophilus]|uniref:GNAT family N-acetyltransferase n=1 Tax=Thermus thermophilus TaxID=274 RepID=UPI001FCC07C7|nr:GNAT family N-acetyltransferase [Thermus thermophilus]BDG20009.1 hypothetical protein TthSNM11_22120 [Thermus thermophilus]